jgi:glucokinase
MKLVLGIDLGGTNTKIGLISKEGKILSYSEFETGGRDSFEAFLQKLKNEYSTIKIQLAKEFELLGIGIGAPNANHNTGCMEYPPNFRWGEIIPLAESIENLFGVNVIITNDANAAAIGELEYGIARGMKNFVLLTLGTGLGGGIVIEGHLLHGAYGMAGEIGHVNVKPEGRLCNCGLHGCLEAYASATGVKRTVFKFLAEWQVDSPLRKISYDDMNGVMIAEAALAGDSIALQAFEYTGDILGNKLADIAAYFDPEAIILAGGLTKAGDILLNPTKKSMNKNIFVAYRNKQNILISDMSGKDAVLGAAALFWNEGISK